MLGGSDVYHLCNPVKFYTICVCFSFSLMCLSVCLSVFELFAYFPSLFNLTMCVCVCVCVFTNIVRLYLCCLLFYPSTHSFFLLLCLLIIFTCYMNFIFVFILFVCLYACLSDCLFQPVFGWLIEFLNI